MSTTSKQKYDWLPILHIQGTSEEMTCIMERLGFRLSHVPNQTLCRKSIHRKDKITAKERTNVAYKIDCKECQQYYAGETGRELGTRLEQHQAAIRQQHNKPSNTVQAHTSHNGHNLDLDNTTIITTDPRKKGGLFKEAWLARNDALN